MLGRDPFPRADQRVPGAFPHVRQVHGIDPVGHLADTAQVLRLTPAVQVPALTCPVSSSAPTARPCRRPVLRAASSSPATANRRTTPIASNVSHTARLSSRWVLSGAWSPACAAIVHPLRLGIWLITAAAYLPACSHGSVRAKHGRSNSEQLGAFPACQRGAYPGGSSRLRTCCPHKRMIGRRLRRARPLPASAETQVKARMAVPCQQPGRQHDLPAAPRSPRPASEWLPLC